LTEFHPLVRNPHLSTILGNFWPRRLDAARFPEERRVFQTEADVRVLVFTQRPHTEPRAQLLLVHGLEGSSGAGYKRSMAQHALENGFLVHRFNMRSCGGTEDLAPSNYHAGQTSDLLYVVRQLAAECEAPIFLGGFSLGGNVVLKLAGELGEAAHGLIGGVAAISTPIDLARCVKQLERPSNFIYEWRFVSRLKQRIRKRARQYPELYDASRLGEVRTVYQFDDWYTARYFGFGTAANYYATQSSMNFLDAVRVPALLIQAKDDPLIPFQVYRDHPAFASNPNLELLAVEHGGHLGFLARGRRRFWLDPVVLGWISGVADRLRARVARRQPSV
jgi:predicted alpha/beta-fold hydrolase